MRQQINQSPLVSVILPVHNASKYLSKALESLRYQTYDNFEIIAIDDASTDDSYAILKKYAQTEPRLRVFRNKTNLKIARTLNFGLTKAKGSFIARMDADDFSLPNRFLKQVKFLLAHPGVVVVGGQCLTIDKDDRVTGEKIFPTTHIGIHDLMYTANPLQHPSIMIRRSLLPKNFSWYNPLLTPAEDLDLFFRLGKYGLYANLHSFILMYRQHIDSETFKNPKYTFQITQKVRHLAVRRYGYRPSLKSKIVSQVQKVVIKLIPTSMIFPLYTLVRRTKIKETMDHLRLRLSLS
ncbi:MAG TPA: glycosyltransferase family 2 protein [Candidatus Woesebacteria bacterium]|nr:glycosyltransferase family 2 protein [Candidatus Woesebacteria bacterium]